MAIRLALLVLLVFASASRVSADDWRSHVPPGWLATVAVRDLVAFEEHLEGLLAVWQRSALPMQATLDAYAPGVEFAKGSWGLALVSQQNQGVAPLLFVPTDDFERFCEALNADAADEIAIARVAGYDLELRPSGDWVRVSLLDDDVPDGEAGNDSLPASESSVEVRVSSAGLNLIAKQLTQRRQGQIAGGHGRIGPWKWPDGFEAALERLAPYGPLFETLASYEVPFTLGLASDTPGDALVAKLQAPIEVPSTRSDPVPGVPASKPIVRTTIPGKLPSVFIDLYLAWMHCHPDAIEAPIYPQPYWDDYADAQRRFLEGCRGMTEVIHMPGESQPVSANRSAYFRWAGDAASLGDAMKASSFQWNRLVDASKSRAPARTELAPSETTGGWEQSVDLYESSGVAKTPEIEALFDQFYGHGGRIVVQIAPAGDQLWHTSMHPSYESPNQAAPPDETRDESVLLRSEIRVDRMLAWRKQVDDIDQQGTIGRRVRPPMSEAPPAELTIRRGRDHLEAEGRLPRATYQALADYWLVEKQPE